MTIKITKEELFKLYWKEEYSLEEIGKIFNCGRETIRKRLKEFRIKKRTRKESCNTRRFQRKCSMRNTRENNPHWKGGIIKANGYILILRRDHPNADNSGYVKRARLVAEKTLGRYLYPNEIPHHKNEIKDDDLPENIDVMTEFEHRCLHNRKRARNSEQEI